VFSGGLGQGSEMNTLPYIQENTHDAGLYLCLRVIVCSRWISVSFSTPRAGNDNDNGAPRCAAVASYFLRLLLAYKSYYCILYNELLFYVLISQLDWTW